MQKFFAQLLLLNMSRTFDPA